MVYFIIGSPALPREEAVEDVLSSHKLEAGFRSRGREAGYDLVDIVDGHSIPLARKTAAIPANWDEELTHGKFSFSRAGIKQAETIVQQAVNKGAKSILLDEIGKLEITDRGFHSALTLALARIPEVYIGCRKINIENIKKIFNIAEKDSSVL